MGMVWMYRAECFIFKGNSQDLEFVLGTDLHSSCLAQDLLNVKLQGLLSWLFILYTNHRAFAQNTTEELSPLSSRRCCRSLTLVRGPPICLTVVHPKFS